MTSADLQGQFSFVVFDSSKRRLFAARDASGTEPLYVTTEEDGTMAFTNSPTSSLADKCDTWQEVQLPPAPGCHFSEGSLMFIMQGGACFKHLTQRVNRILPPGRKESMDYVNCLAELFAAWSSADM